MSQSMIDVTSGTLEAASLDYLVEILTSEKDYSTLFNYNIIVNISFFRQNRLRHVLVDVPKFCNAGSIVEQVD